MPWELDPPITPTPGTSQRLAQLRVITAPTSRPITWAEAKAQLRLDDDNQQAYVEELIDAAADYAQDRLHSSLMFRTLEATFYEGQRLELPYGPIIEVLGIVDADEETPTDYDTENVGHATRVILNESATYPLSITYKAGYLTADAIPASIRHAIKTHVGSLFENRESVSDREMIPVPNSLKDFYRLKARHIGIG